MSVFVSGIARAAAVFSLAFAAHSGWSISDTLRLPEAIIQSSRNDGFRYVPQSDSLLPLLWRSLSLGALLEKSASLDVRSYGNTSLQTLSFRGAQAQHTRVLWQDLELNSATLGMFDFSAVQCVAADVLQVLPGLAGIRADNGALGGTVILGQQFCDSTTFGMGLSAGAFGMREINGRADFASERWCTSTRLSFRQLRNDYTYDNYTVKPWRVDTLTNSGLAAATLVQGISFRSDERNSWQAWLWINGADRALPGTLLAENMEGTRQKDNQIRAVVSHDFIRNSFEQRLSVGLTNEFQHYSSWFESRIRTNHYQLVHRASLSLGKKTRVRSLFRGGLENAVSDGFSEGARRTVIRHTLGLEYAMSEYFSVDVNLSQWLSGKASDWMNPALAFRFRKGKFSSYVNAGRAVRFPTLNDLFWQPGGNPDLHSEQSLTTEAGGALEWPRTEGVFRGFRVSGNGYITKLTDLIAWIPGEGFWTAVNIHAARMTGVESEMHSYFLLFGQKINLGGSYGYSVSKDEKAQLQLPYVPIHRARVFVSGQSKKWLWGAYFRHIGRRPVNAAQGLWMQAHDVVDFSLQRTFDFKNISGIFGIELMNALNASYQVMAYMPMPGRHANFKINIIW